MTVIRWLVIALTLTIGFAAGVAAQRSATTVSMQGVVMDANTLAEEIEYWELRSSSGQSIVVTGRKDSPLIQWLRQSKGRPALLSIERQQPAH